MESDQGRSTRWLWRIPCEYQDDREFVSSEFGTSTDRLSVTLSSDGQAAKGRWNGIRFQGDGKGGSRIRGGIYENEFVLTDQGWKFSLMHFYAMYAGNYSTGWRNIDNKTIPIIPYHFTPDTVSPIPPPAGEAPATAATSEQLATRISRLNDEDEVRNLQNAYGYYLDRRMWDDVVDMFVPNATVSLGGASFRGPAGVRQAMERKGPQGLTLGILNDHPIFDTIVEVHPDGRGATARGFEIGMIGDVTARTSSWEFNVFRNEFVRDADGLWKFKALNISPLVVANYSTGWGYGSIVSSTQTVPPFLSTLNRSAKSFPPDGSNTSLSSLARRLARSAAFDGAENLSAAYGYYLDDLRCEELGAIHASYGHKASPFSGWFQTPARVAKACKVVYGEVQNPNPQRSSISFHWRPQPVVLTSMDGRSATLRARLLQPGTSITGSGGFNGAIYHDQMALEDGKWKLWSITIDEHYWTSSGWSGGWAGVRMPNVTNTTAPRNASSASALNTRFPPDIPLTALGEREATFRGGSGRTITWPEIQRMWFQYRNPVSGRVPDSYWPGCVPCGVRSGWNLTDRGWLEPPTGPTLLSVTSGANIVNVHVRAGPGEPVEGAVELSEGGKARSTQVLSEGVATFTIPLDESGVHTLTASYGGSERLREGKAVVTVTAIGPPPFPAETGGADRDGR
jgi:hypothetical protein